ncbi:MAG TPA: hydantoinase B/oxoprolinase family protein, partial [Ramlibacter sp.]|nr:hydantoinase B/oxoprolinase family protein [Ramlibacter sp.]
MSDALANFRLQLIWDRLISIVEEQAQTLIRTAFSASTREAGDLSAGVFDPAGLMLAQAVTGTPGHINTMAAAVGHFLKAIPAADMGEGDVYLTNDPWMGSGHLNDFTVVTPVHHGGELVALFAATVHVIDIGGQNTGVNARDVYEEGFYVPIMPLAAAGRLNEVLLRLLRANVREPIQVEGDLYSLMACNRAGAQRLGTLLDEFGVETFREAGEHILKTSRAAMLRAIAASPQGTWKAQMEIDGIDTPVMLAVTLTIDGEGICIDFAGTSPVSSFGINVPKTYCDAYSSYAVRCVIGPEIPNNAGSLSTIRVVAPAGSIVNALHPSPVCSRHMIGQLLPDAVFGALRQALPDRVPAEGSSTLWNLRLSSVPGRGAPFLITTFNAGGMGARPGLDGLAATSFPAGVRNVPIEIIEAITPLVFWRKELRGGTGGAGRYRGGDGQIVEVGHRDGDPFSINPTFERVVRPAR